MSFPNRDRGWYLDEAVKYARRGLRNAARCTVGESLRTAHCNGAATLSDLARPSNHTQSNRGAENLKVVIVDFVLEPFLADLVEAVKLVEIDGVAVRHNQSVKN